MRTNDPYLSPVLRADGVTKSFASVHGPVEILHKVDLSIQEGEFVGITGPSGSGKTSFLNLAALLDRPSSGGLFFNGADVEGMDDTQLADVRKRNVGIVFQQFQLLAHRSVLDNVMFRFRYLSQSRTEARKCAEHSLKQMGLSAIAQQRARLCSGGEMQRIAIARAVALRPRLLLADEPTGNLDRTTAHSVMECFQELNRSGITIVMVTHNESLLDYCSRQVVCEEGVIHD